MCGVYFLQIQTLEACSEHLSYFLTGCYRKALSAFYCAQSGLCDNSQKYQDYRHCGLRALSDVKCILTLMVMSLFSKLST